MINIDNKKINAIKLGTNNYKRAYVGNNLVFQQGKWVFYKTKRIYQSSVAEYHGRLLTVEKESPNGGKFLFMIPDSGQRAMIQFYRIPSPMFVLDGKPQKGDEALFLDFTLIDQYHNYLVTAEWGKFDVAKNRFYDGRVYRKDKPVGSGWTEAYPLDGAYYVDIDIYKWQEE